MSWPTSVLPRGDGAVKRRGDAGENFHFLKPVQIGERGVEIRLFQFEVGLFLGGFLFADAGGLEQFRPARGGDFREIERGLVLRHLGLGLRELLVQFRRFNFRQQLAVGHRRADVHQPAFQIAAGARVNRRFHKRLHFRRQRHAEIAFARATAKRPQPWSRPVPAFPARARGAMNQRGISRWPARSK